LNRRKFIFLSAAGVAASGIPIPGKTSQRITPEDNQFRLILKELIIMNDKSVPGTLESQNNEKGSPNSGGVPDQFGLYNAGSTAGLISRLAISFTSQESAWFLSGKLVGAMIPAAKYLLKIQHPDGTIDLLSTNFSSTPDTGFVAEPLSIACTLLNRIEFDRKQELLGLLEKFLKNAGKAFILGGVHTPNHRWVVCMALARVNALFPDQQYVKRIEEWLHEGIDIDADGQYTEHSTLIYTPLTNRCLLTIGKFLNRPELLDPIRKNLEMTLFYIHPNGEVATEASGRQDQYQVGTMEGYHLSYRYMAINDKNPRFSAITGFIENSMPEKLLSYLQYYLEDETYLNNLPQPESLSDHYTKEFPVSKLVRIRRGNTDATILAGNSTFFTLTSGKAVLASVKMASAFFGKGQFISQVVRKVNDSFVLDWEFTWGYFQPFPENEKPDPTIEFDVDRKRRKMSEVQKLMASISIRETGGTFEMAFDISGVDNVPLAVELGFRNGGTLRGVVESENEKGSWLLKEGYGKYTFEGDTIEFGPGEATHSWTRIRGSLPRPDATCVYLTGSTPYSRKITFS
jgi:hypothetical protein